MKTRITLIIAALLTLSLYAAAQTPVKVPQQVKTTVSESKTEVTFQVGQAICFTKTGYYEGYEILQGSARVQVDYLGFTAGFGLDFAEDNTGQCDLSFRGGYTLPMNKLRLQFFGILQRGFGREYEQPMTLAGGGIYGELKVKGPVGLFVEYRSLYPMFIRATNPYYNSYYRATAAYLTFGLAVSF